MAFGPVASPILPLRRRWLAARCRAAPLRDVHRADLPSAATRWTEVEFLALDLETTGLDPARDAILSIGWVPLSGGAIRLAGAGYRLVAADRPVGENSAALHGILDRHLADAPSLPAVLPELLEALTGRVAIAHHAPMEQRFLGAACRRHYGCPLAVPFIDTLALERRSFARRGRVPGDGDLRLPAARARRGLPRYRLHHALGDALACAELFLAQATAIGGKRPARLGDLL
ncbi:MAG: exonuclease domain-containing protein [Azospirillaceae bacterium]